ncbi:MAG TPA: signal peptidase I [Pyrinomonadaceae bacterium]
MDNEQTGTGLAEPHAGQEASTGTAAHATGAGEPDAQRADGHGAATAAEPTPHRAHGIVREYFESLVVTAIMALFGMTFVVQAVKVPTGSMQNTILIGDHLLVNKFIFAPGADDAPFFLPQREIRRGDIIVFKYPGKFDSPQFANNPDVNDEREDNRPFKTNYVKRVVGLPGDHIEERDGRILINGEVLQEQRVAAIDLGRDRDEDDPLRDAPLQLAPAPPLGEGPYSVYYRPEALRSPRATFRGATFDVPPGHYFVMGDNRENSLDSRFWGYVPRELVIGRALFVYWSYDESLPRSNTPYIGYLVDFVQNTRWSRTGTLVK